MTPAIPERVRGLALLCLLSLPFPGLAQLTTAQPDARQAELPIPEITVLGTRLSEPVPATEIIEAGQIRLSQPLTLAELLRRVPGITAIEPGGAGGVTEVYLRGADPNFTTVFINGVKQNDPTDARGGAFDFASVFPGDIRRIELVRGPFTALYGSGALAGAINIDTRAPLSEVIRGQAQVSIGTDGYWHAGGGVYGPTALGQAGVNLSHVDYGEPTQGSTRKVSSLNANLSSDFSHGFESDHQFSRPVPVTEPPTRSPAAGRDWRCRHYWSAAMSMKPAWAPNSNGAATPNRFR